jgi:DedD protein
MDRALKERIVGALVLVVLAVLVVPEFLDGSADTAQVVTESVVLPGPNGQTRKQQTIVLQRDRNEPVPAMAGRDGGNASERAMTATAGTAEASAPDSPPPEHRQTPPEPEPEKESPAPAAVTAGAEQVKAGPVSSTGMWAVQLGSFSNPANAERLAADLRAEGYAAFLSQLPGPKGPLHRVRVGPQKDRDSADAIAARLVAAGHKGQVVPHP